MCTIGLTKGSRCAIALTFLGSDFLASADLFSFTATTAPVLVSPAFAVAGAAFSCASVFFLLKGSLFLEATAPFGATAVLVDDGADFTATTGFEAFAGAAGFAEVAAGLAGTTATAGLAVG